MRSAVADVKSTCRTDDVEVLPDIHLEPHLRPRLAHARRHRFHQLVGIHVGKVTDENRHSVTETHRVTGQRTFAMQPCVANVGGFAPTTRCRSIDDIVVEQRHRMKHLERRASPHDIGVRCTTAGECAEQAEGRAHSLAASEHERAQFTEENDKVGVVGRPAQLFAFDQCGEFGLDITGQFAHEGGNVSLWHRFRRRPVRRADAHRRSSNDNA